MTGRDIIEIVRQMDSPSGYSPQGNMFSVGPGVIRWPGNVNRMDNYRYSFLQGGRKGIVSNNRPSVIWMGNACPVMGTNRRR